MPLLKHGKCVPDDWRRVPADEEVPGDGPVIVDLARWKTDKESLVARDLPVGVLLRPDELPEEIEGDVERLALVALDFPKFNDGRAFSSARILREQYGFQGEIRAVGEVALEQLHFMERSGFDAFELDSDDPERDWQIAQGDMTNWYQPTGDGRPTAIRRRHG